MFGFRFLGKTHVPHCKNTAGAVPTKMLPPKEVLLPVSQHIGAPATVVVKVGDEVKVGQLIAEASGYVSAPIHSSVSGKVIKIENVLLNDGREVPAVRIESDGLMSVVDGLTPPEINDFDSLVEAVKASGLVGLGGAGFPTSVKIDGARSGGVNTIVINAAECEPYITSDTRTMLDKPESVFDGISILEKCIPGVKKIIFGIEKNKPECIEEMARIFADNSKVSILPLPTLYPQGAEKVIVYNTTGRVVPEGKLPVDVGVLVMNVTSLAVLGHFVKTGMPLVEKCVTVDGSAVKEPKNVIVPIGTPIKDVIEFVGVDTENIGKILFGGPMMGIAACSIDEPITKRNNALTVMTVADANERDATACIHCGRCVESCPMNLNPTAYASALNLGTEEKIAKLEAYSINLCMECGCCSYVCPANRPLVQNNRLAKAVYRDYKAHKSTLK
jgi:electron transport complex protein RnfC